MRGVRFANVISLIALFVALGGGAYAAVKLKNNQVKSKHIAPNAAKGVDVDEASLGPVPNANLAARATTAENASAVSGVPIESLQFGDGVSDATAGFLPGGETGGINLFAGGVGIECDGSPELVYVDTPGDAFDSDLWVDGAHSVVPDGDDTTSIALGGTSDTALVQAWGGGGSVAQAVVSVDYQAGPDECAVAITAQENLDDSQATAGRARSGARAELPGGWVELDGAR